MLFSKSFTLLSIALLLVGIVGNGPQSPAAQQPEVPANSLGKSIADFTLKDTSGQPVSLAQFKDKKAIAVIFLGTQCPINNAYLPRLASLHKEFAAKEVAFLAINSNQQDGANEMAQHAKKNEIPFPVLRDDSNVIADRFGAQRNPEAFILDEKRVIRYQGRIDDQFGFDFQRKEPTRRDLAEALNEVLAGMKVTVASTSVAGCIIGRVQKTRENGPVTFTKHIAPLLQHHCQSCHRPGQIGPMPLIQYDDVVSWSAMIKEVVTDGRMPPWYADPKHGKFSNDRSMPREQREQLLAWIDGGMAKGDVKDQPPPANFPEGWQIGKPDVVLNLPDFDVPAEMPKFGIKYQYSSVDLKFDEDKWVERAEARAGAPEVVHHILAFIVPPGEKFFPGNPTTPVLTGMAPGESPLVLPRGMAKLVPKGSRVHFQIHYTPNGRAQKDSSSIALVFAKQPPEKMVITRPVYNQMFAIPPGAENHEVQSSYSFKKDGYIISMMPHMHLRGKDFLVKTVREDGKTETVLSVPRFNFNWQSIYRPVEPIPMPKGSKVMCVAHYDNSRNNPSNPNPREFVLWGDQTWQEMMIGWMDFAFDMPKEGDKKK
jgi:peroxiredoxin